MSNRAKIRTHSGLCLQQEACPARKSAIGVISGVQDSGGILIECFFTASGVWYPFVLLERAAKPIAVLPKPVPVAGEVEKVNPDLVSRGVDRKVYTVRYDAVNAMLLNEFIKEHQQVHARACHRAVADHVGISSSIIY
jgi:hypothetical protein